MATTANQLPDDSDVPKAMVQVRYVEDARLREQVGPTRQKTKLAEAIG